jgi:hypothetical protein
MHCFHPAQVDKEGGQLLTRYAPRVARDRRLRILSQARASVAATYLPERRWYGEAASRGRHGGNA